VLIERSGLDFVSFVIVEARPEPLRPCQSGIDPGF